MTDSRYCSPAWFMTPCLAGEKSNKSSYGPSPQRPAVAPKVGPVILKAAALIFQLRAIIGLCPHDAGASRKQCPEHSQRIQICGRLTEPKVGRSAQGAAYCADPFAGQRWAASQPRKMEGVKRIHTLAGRHGSTLLNIRAATQATFPGKERGRPSLHPAASHPRQASHTCRGMGFRAVR